MADPFRSTPILAPSNARRRVRLLLMIGIAAGTAAYRRWEPILADPWFRADVAWGLGLYDIALAGYLDVTTAQSLHPRSAEATWRISRCLHDLDRHAESMSSMEGFIVRFPNDPLRPLVETELQAYEMAYVAGAADAHAPP